MMPMMMMMMMMAMIIIICYYYYYYRHHYYYYYYCCYHYCHTHAHAIHVAVSCINAYAPKALVRCHLTHVRPGRASPGKLCVNWDTRLAVRT